MAKPNIKQLPPPPGGEPTGTTFTYNGEKYTKDQFVTYYTQNWETDPTIREDFINLFYSTGIFYGVELAATGPTRRMWERIGDWAISKSKEKGGKFTLTSENMIGGINYAISDKNKTRLADFGAYIRPDEGGTGTVDTTANVKAEQQAVVELNRFAYDNGIILSESSAKKLAKILTTPADKITKEDIAFIRGGTGVLKGLAEDIGFAEGSAAVTLDSTKQYLRNKYVLPKYAAFADEIKAGFDIRDIANDYVQMVSQSLEIDPESVDLNDPLIQRALKPSKSKKGGKDISTFDYISYGDFQTEVRKDSRWQYTKNAKESLSETASGIKRLFGL